MATTRKPGPPLALAITLLVVGAIVLLSPVAVIGIRAIKTFRAGSLTTPAVTHRHLTPGTWTVYERTGTRRAFGIYQGGPPTIDPSEVTVTDPEGGRLFVETASGNETITKGSRIYTSALDFRVPLAAEYEIRLDTRGPDDVVITRPLVSAVHGIAGFVVLGGFGGLLLIAGFVSLIVGIVRRSGARRAVVTVPPWYATGTPAGWYLDPMQPGRQRWWDGARWTDHYA